MSLEPRVYEIERRLGQLERALANDEQRLTGVEQSSAKLWGLPFGGVGGSATVTHWCRGTFAAATGSWPSITPSEITADVYADVGGTLTLFAASQTIRWYYLDASGSNKLTPVFPAGDGAWDAITASCSGV